MDLTLRSIREDQPGPRWQALFEAYWPAYQKWFLSEGHLARSDYLTSVKKFRQYMPELLPVYKQLVDLAGGGNLAACFLSLYRPPPYLCGCSQAVWSRYQPILVRNYDYSPNLFEGTLLYTAWRRPVIAITDCLWGVLDGINEAGLAVSLSFGGRKVVGDGFGIPLILRYILEVCEDTAAATTILQRVPAHMSYNVTMVDRNSVFATAYLSPDRPTVIVDAPISTNHQQHVEWADYAHMTATIERQEFLATRLAASKETACSFIDRFMQPPLYQTRYGEAFGTLYTAAYYPLKRAVEYFWPSQPSLRQSFAHFKEQTVVLQKLAEERNGNRPPLQRGWRRR
jgi:predicted choloylglycine hydrolase